MARGSAQRGAAEQRAQQLPATHWTLLRTLRWPGSPDRRIDEVLVGPCGVQVVLHWEGPLPPLASGGTEGALLEEAAGRAAAAALAVGDLLPDRYRRVVTAALCLTDTVEVGLSVGAVFAASPGVLQHSWRHQPRVLSTSEADAIARRLRTGLEPFPIEPAPSRGNPWWGWRRLWLAGVVAAAGGVAVVAAGAVQPWAHP
jgi:hypothetical protein